MGQAAEPPFRRVLPGVVHSRAEDGTRIETATWLVNLGASAASFEFGFLPSGGVPAPPVQSRLLAPGETLRLNNALEQLFGLGESSGALIVRGDQPFELRGVTTNVTNPLGGTGQGVNSLSSAELLAPGASGHSLWLANRSEPNAGPRTEITAVLTAPGTAVTVSLYDVTGLLRGIEVVSSEQPTIWRSSASQLLPDPEIPIGRVKFAVTSGEATGFLSVTGGAVGTALLAQPEPIAAATPDGLDLLLNGLEASTDLRLFNPNESGLEITIEPLGSPGAGVTMRRTLRPGELIEIPGILGADGFARPPGATGALRLRAPLPFLATGRGVPRAVPYEAGFAAPARPTTLVGLSETSSQPGVRSRIALLAGSAGARGFLRLRDARGAQIATAPIQLEASEGQARTILAWFPGTEVPSDARVDIELEGGSAHGYAEVVDNFTQSRVLVTAAAVPPPMEVNVPPAATRLAFASLPASIASGAPFTAMIRALRPDSSIDPRFTRSVELRVASGPGALPDTAPRNAVDGVASFPGLSLTTPGRYTLTALAAGLESAVSEPIDVSAPAPSVIRIGTFRGQNGYNAEGTVQIERASDGRETLRLNPNFRVSTGPGAITVWLARSSGPLNPGTSLRVGILTTVFAGEFTFPIPAQGSAGFTHVIVYCDPFRINFGAAELRNP